MTSLLPIVVCKALIEVALLILLGRGVLAVLIGADAGRREANIVYRLFELGSRPLVRLARAVLPRQWPDRRLPLLVAGVLLIAWCALVSAKWQACKAQPWDPACRAMAAARSR